MIDSVFSGKIFILHGLWEMRNSLVPPMLFFISTLFTPSSVAATGCPVPFIGIEHGLHPFTMKPFVKKLKGEALITYNLVIELGNQK